MNVSRWKFLAAAPLATAALAVGLVSTTPTAAAAQPDSAPISAQACTQKGPFSPSFDARWKADLSLNTDQVVLGEEIAAYRIQWFSGAWSDEWYIPGVNDVDWVDSNRRVWSYFYDHNYQYISCS